MSLQSGSPGSETLPPAARVHVLGAGPVGLVVAALLQSTDRFSVSLYEKRRDYSRTRMVQLAPYLVADSIESYCTDYIDSESIEAIFDPAELAQGLAFRRSIPPDLMGLLREWTLGFCPLNAIERGLSNLIDARPAHPVRRTTAVVSAQDAMTMLGPEDVLIDCTGTRSLFRDALVPAAAGTDGEANTFKLRLEYALVVTFLYGQAYDCNEYCKYYKNIDNAYYKFIPAVSRTCYDGRLTHVTGIVNITAEDYEQMPSRFDGQWLRTHFPRVAQSMDGFITKIKTETNGEIVGDLEIVRIPLDLYRARNATSLQLRRAGNGDHPFGRAPVFLVGDSAMGSPYFQSISLGFECAIFLAGLLAQPDLPVTDMLERYEQFIYKQWLRVYMRTKMIKHNKDLFECVGDTFALLKKLHIY
ncbi:MAG TPA: NAD(P)-binding protein [Gemmatimonadales bacterium]|nr:NAD(P)-binding protein [Gemmatimonadales bacterium]